ncbi:hypothetical protein Plhal304r1_c032g0102221 [Plasmopara halstedii]
MISATQMRRGSHTEDDVKGYIPNQERFKQFSHLKIKTICIINASSKIVYIFIILKIFIICIGTN